MKNVLLAQEAYSPNSLEGRAQAVRTAYQNSVATGAVDSFVEEVFDGYLIVCRGDKHFQVSYAIGADGAVSFGDPVEVRMEYVAVNEALEALMPKGKKWEVRLIREGVNKKTPPWIYTRKALETLLPFVAGAPFRAVEAMPGVYEHNGKSTVIGKLGNPTAQESDGFYEPRAEAEIADEHREWLLGEMRAGHVNGVSINAPVEAVTLPGGQIWVKKFMGLKSLDLATTPAAGGAFLRATEGVAEGEDMKEDEVVQLVRKLLAQEAEGINQGAKRDGSLAYLTLKLSESKLPAPVKKMLEQKYRGQIFARETLDADLTAIKQMLDELVASGRVQGAGETRVEFAREAQDRVQIALDKTFGVKVEGNSDIKPWRGLREAYVQITGDGDVSGRLPAHRMQARETIVSSDFPNLLANTLHRRVVQDYREVDYNERILISYTGSAIDFKTQEANRVGYFSDIPIVDPEAGDYLEAAKPGEEQIAYKVETRGELVKVTRKSIINDDLGGLLKRIKGRGRAYRRTFARYIWSFYESNATYDGDSTAWFNAGGHVNLLSDVIAAAKIQDMVTKIKNMTEPDSGEKLGLSGDETRRLNLVVGHTLEWTAKGINQAQYLDANFTVNPAYHLFGENNERIIVSPLEADPNDWGILCDPNDREILEVKFLNGQQEPEFFLADQPAVGEMLARDTLVFKDRHEYGADLIDYRNGCKSIVA